MERANSGVTSLECHLFVVLWQRAARTTNSLEESNKSCVRNRFGIRRGSLVTRAEFLRRPETHFEPSIYATATNSPHYRKYSKLFQVYWPRHSQNSWQTIRKTFHFFIDDDIKEKPKFPEIDPSVCIFKGVALIYVKRDLLFQYQQDFTLCMCVRAYFLLLNEFIKLIM